MSLVALWVGGLVPTAVVSQLLVWAVPSKLRADTLWLYAVHGGSLLVCALLFAFGAGEGGFEKRLANLAGRGLRDGIIAYSVPQAVLFVVELYWRKRRATQRTGIQ